MLLLEMARGTALSSETLFASEASETAVRLNGEFRDGDDLSVDLAIELKLD